MKTSSTEKTCDKCGQMFSARYNNSQRCDSCCSYTCLYCGKTFISRRRRSIKFCSLECTNNWQKQAEVKEEARKRTTAIRGRGRVERCKTCCQQFYVPGWSLDKGNGVYCSRLCRRISISLACPVCGTSFSRPPSDIRSKNYCSDQCRNAGTLQRMATGEWSSETKLEIAGRAILSGLEIPFAEQTVIGGKFTVDVLIASHRTVIQWDGDFWHANPTKFTTLTAIQKANVNRDRSCNAYLAKCGYRVLRFWEKDVHSRPSWVAEEIVRALANSERT